MSNNNFLNMQRELLTKINDITKKIDDCNTELNKLKELTRKVRQKYHNLNTTIPKPNNYYNKINELKELLTKINKRKKVLKSNLLEYHSQLNILNKDYTNLEQINQFNLNDILEIITYLVSKIENKDYLLKSLPVLISVNQSFKYNLVYLTEEDKQSLAFHELQKRFSHMIDKSAIEDNNIGNNYLQLLIYKENDLNLVIFDDFDSKTKIYTYMKDTPIIPHTKIYDLRYNYIYAFLNMVIEHKLENLFLTKEDIYKIAEEFIENNSKSLRLK